MSLNAMEIGNRIKERQKELKMKQKDILEKTNIAHSSMSTYVTGAGVPNTEAIFKIAKALDTTVEWLLTGEMSNNSTLTEDERELLMLFNQLPQREQIKVIGILEEKVKDYKIPIQINMSEKTS